MSEEELEKISLTINKLLELLDSKLSSLPEYENIQSFLKKDVIKLIKEIRRLNCELMILNLSKELDELERKAKLIVNE